MTERCVNYVSKKKSYSLISRLMKFADFPIEASGRVSTVEIKGDSEVYITGCEGILEFESERIVIKAIKQNIEILGEGLEISEFLSSGVCASGVVNEVRITRRV